MLIINNKCYNLIILLFVLMITGLVRSVPLSVKNRNVNKGMEEYDNDSTTSQTTCVSSEKIVIPKYAVILMGLTIALLLFAVIILLTIIYKLKRKIYCESIEDKSDIANDDFSNKYKRQISSETNDLSLSRQNCNEESRFQLLRQNSKMTIVEFPTHYENKVKKQEEPRSATKTLSTVLNKPVEPMQREFMKTLCEAVKQRMTESTSFAYLDEILNENSNTNKGSSTLLKTEKSASSPLLDVAESFESISSTPRKKVEELPKSVFIYKNSVPGGKKEYLPLCLPKINTKKIDEPVQEDINDNLPKKDKTENDEDDVYDNPLSTNRPVKNSKDDDEHSDEVYDNPPSMIKPVCGTSNSNKPINYNKNEIEHLDDLYDNPLCNKVVIDKGSTVSSQDTNEKTDSQYDFPHKHSRGIVVEHDEDSEYIGTFTTDKETCFESKYMNAKTLNRNKK